MSKKKVVIGIIIIIIAILLITYIATKVVANKYDKEESKIETQELVVVLKDNILEEKIKDIGDKIRSIDGVNSIFYKADKKTYNVTFVDLKLKDYVKQEITKISDVKSVSDYIANNIYEYEKENEIRFIVIMAVIITITLIIGIPIYLLPTIVAIKRKHKQRASIIILNIFLGWSLIGWVGALIWACLNNDNETEIKSNKYENIERIQKLKESGAISEEEFETEKAKLLR